ncbi:MAG: hypothetical protein ACK4N5_14910, partial [Myxococcales bacterium]
QRLPQGESPPELILEGVGMRLYRGSELRAIGSAQQASFRQAEGDVTAERGELRVLDRSDASREAAQTVVRARSVTGNLREQQADATGAVEIEDADGTRGATTRAHFDGVQKRASGSEPVSVVGRDERFTTDAEGGFNLDLRKGGKLSFVGPVRSLLKEGAK